VSRDRGSASLWLAGLATLVGLATLAATLQGAAMVARHRTTTAADLAALAAAVRVPDGAAAACAAASRIAARNGGVLSRCVVSGTDVEVSVDRPVVFGGLGSWTATAEARAGPVDGTAPPA
jgi:secretion/DNA translocation related TadE-like protein